MPIKIAIATIGAVSALATMTAAMIARGTARPLPPAITGPACQRS